MSTLRERVVSGVAWNMGEKFASIGVQGLVLLVTMRYLTPAELGLLAIPTTLLPIVLNLVDGGFSQAIVRMPRVTATDLRAVFRFNLWASVAFSALLLLLTVPMARFFEVAEIERLLPVLLLILPLNALGSVQNALLIRELRFARQSRILFLSNCAAGVVAVAMVVAGAGIWCVVGQRITAMGARTAMLWWGRRGVFGGEKGGEGAALSAMRPYSVRLLVTELVFNVSEFLPSGFVVKLSSPATVGYFNQSQKQLAMVSNATKAPVQSVSFPALASVGEQPRKFAESYRQLLLMTAFWVFPLVAGLIVVAPALFAGLLGKQASEWLPILPYLRVALLGAFFAPLSMVAYNVLKVKTNGRAVLRWVVIKKSIALAALLISYRYGALAILWALSAVAAVELLIDLTLARPHADLPLSRIGRAVGVPAVLAAIMAAALYIIGMAPWPPLPLLLVQVAAGVGLYAGLAFAVRAEGFAVLRQIIKKRAS